MTLHYYEFDREAQKLILKYRDDDVLNESHKMRVTAAYGLERFWGEHLRLMCKGENTKDFKKGLFWKAVWDKLVDTMKIAGIEVPNDNIERNGRNFSTPGIDRMTQKFWDSKKFPIEHQRVTLAVLTQLCDSLVWWTQRYKKSND
ncbi:hypothetical protein [Nostoc sp. CCY0012]|uniref:hypothetical protein n=1 Tax=Nostoc sp. CCY0012 TaxID=1056123 RepID=UPI0039C6A41A